MPVVIAPDKFKGVLPARDVARAIAGGFRRARPDVRLTLVPMADGGEGTLDVLVDARGGNRRRLRATGPLGQDVEVVVGLVDHASTAVVEMAHAAGYARVPPDRRDPLRTTTYGLGEVLRAVYDSGVERIILGVGGSATVDGGAGMMQALGMTLLDANGRPLPPGIGGGDLERIRRFAWESPPAALDQIRITVACDVLNPACGPRGAAAVYGPQKGADARGVALLEAGLSHWADLLEAACGRRLRDEPGTGAAGGVALPLVALLDAAIVPGVDLVSEAVGLVTKIASADLVLTGEGCLDRQSLMGKVVGAVARMARSADVPCIAIVGKTGLGSAEAASLLDRICTLDAPLEHTAQRLAEVAARIAREAL